MSGKFEHNDPILYTDKTFHGKESMNSMKNEQTPPTTMHERILLLIRYYACECWMHHTGSIFFLILLTVVKCRRVLIKDLKKRNKIKLLKEAINDGDKCRWRRRCRFGIIFVGNINQTSFCLRTFYYHGYCGYDENQKVKWNVFRNWNRLIY